MIIRICCKVASERLNLNNTVQAERSAVTDNQCAVSVSERRDNVQMSVVDNSFFKLLSTPQAKVSNTIVNFYGKIECAIG